MDKKDDLKDDLKSIRLFGEYSIFKNSCQIFWK